MRSRVPALVLAGLFCVQAVLAQDPETEPKAILEVGTAGEWAVKGTGASYGPSLAVETTPIEHWLEIEAGVTPLFRKGQTEWEVDLLLKKPFTLSEKVEFMAGIGPSWSHTISSGRRNDAMGAEAALDFMFWPWQRRKFGWYVEPSYGYSFRAGHEQGPSVSAGLLIAVP